MGATDLFPLADKALQGKLAQRLATLRGKGLSFEGISRALNNEGIPCSAETVRKWCARSDVEVLLSSSKQAS